MYQECVIKLGGGLGLGHSRCIYVYSHVPRPLRGGKAWYTLHACIYILIISQIEANVVLTHMAMRPVAMSCDLQKNASYALYSNI